MQKGFFIANKPLQNKRILAGVNRKKLFLIIPLLCFLNGYTQVGNWKKKMSQKNVSVHDKSYYADSLLLNYRKSNRDSALYYARLLVHYASLDKDTGSVEYGQVHIGSLHHLKGNLDSSLFYYFKTLESYKARKFADGIAAVYNNIATIYKMQSRYDLAIKNYYEALEILKKTRRYNAIGNLYSNFAGLYYLLENHQKALELYGKAKEFFLKEKDVHEITHTYRGIGRIYIQQKKYTEAEKEIKQALAFDSKNNIKVFFPENHLLLMEIYLATGRHNKFRESVKLIHQLLHTEKQAHNLAAYYKYLGDFESKQKNWKKAVQHYDTSLNYANVENLPEVKLDLLKNRLLAAVNAGDQHMFTQEWNEIQQLEKQVQELRQDRITQETEARYNLRDKEALILALNQRNTTAHQLVEKERELKAQGQKQNLYLWIGISGICVFFIYVLFINRKLNTTKKQLEKTVEQKDFLFKELNHRVKNNLHIVNSFLGIEMHGKTKDVQDILKTCEARIHSLGLVHEMLYQGETIEQVELKQYVEKLVSYLTNTLVGKDTTVTTTVSGHLIISSHQSVLLGLIVNELLTNAIKYAKDPSRYLTISLFARQDGKNIVIEIKDDGVGLKEDFTPQKPGSLGMKLANGLTQQLNGTFTYERLNPGTCFRIVFEVK